VLGQVKIVPYYTLCKCMFENRALTSAIEMEKGKDIDW
jgi:hypothetical protein